MLALLLLLFHTQQHTHKHTHAGRQTSAHMNTQNAYSILCLCFYINTQTISRHRSLSNLTNTHSRHAIRVTAEVFQICVSTFKELAISLSNSADLNIEVKPGYRYRDIRKAPPSYNLCTLVNCRPLTAEIRGKKNKEITAVQY